MTEIMSDDSPTTKKRKANDGRATVPDSGDRGFLSSWVGYFSGRLDDTTPTASSTCGGENLTKKMDAMMQMMSRMEERCCRLETECNSLKNMLEMKMISIKEHVDYKFGKQHEHNMMLFRNQSWKYSTPVHSQEYWEDDGYDEDVALYLSENSECLKYFTEDMRRGEFPSDYSVGRKGISFHWGRGEPNLDRDASMKMRPHWEEFARALKQFTPALGVLPDDCETYFDLQNVQLPRYVPRLLKDALMNKPFQTLSFVNRDDVDDNEIMSVDAIMDIMDSNKHLRKLTIGNNRIQLGHMEKICSAVRYGSIVDLGLRNCFENGLGDAMVKSLLKSGGLTKLERLALQYNRITSSSITLLANFLATNPQLRDLNLEDNLIDDNDALVLANALRSNTTLGRLELYENSITSVGVEAFDLVLHGDGNLNSIVDSNHSCVVVGLYQFVGWNVGEKPDSFNRARKLYSLLSARNESMSTSNVQHFDDIDVKILPFILRAVERYASPVYPYDRFNSGYCRVEPLSIVYEVMRKWDKVFPLYTTAGKGSIGIE